jgi:hypothetical protein
MVTAGGFVLASGSSSRDLLSNVPGGLGIHWRKIIKRDTTTTKRKA